MYYFRVHYKEILTEMYTVQLFPDGDDINNSQQEHK